MMWPSPQVVRAKALGVVVGSGFGLDPVHGEGVGDVEYGFGELGTGGWWGVGEDGAMVDHEVGVWWCLRGERGEDVDGVATLDVGGVGCGGVQGLGESGGAFGVVGPDQRGEPLPVGRVGGVERVEVDPDQFRLTEPLG